MGPLSVLAHMPWIVRQEDVYAAGFELSGHVFERRVAACSIKTIIVEHKIHHFQYEIHHFWYEIHHCLV